jgi:hypothetical protein
MLTQMKHFCRSISIISCFEKRSMTVRVHCCCNKYTCFELDAEKEVVTSCLVAYHVMAAEVLMAMLFSMRIDRLIAQFPSNLSINNICSLYFLAVNYSSILALALTIVTERFPPRRLIFSTAANLIGRLLFSWKIAP